MELWTMFGFYFLVMGSLVLIGSGLITFLFPHLKSVIVILISMLSGFIVSAAFELPLIIIISVILNALLSLLAVGTVKGVVQAKQKHPKN
ncbi:hypothetical protein SM124_11400 [Bacillus sp. 31A1R]|uniref:NADH dehydrogenase subunit 4L n=1 Tax=Robertmurraya mangrovi TaxID=3098077 RepID=A0ABU5IYW6_9BACI|nr:hypothetical protein [Bacillus sp. 31A1R]MDZ5472353.1 hypothetical protein [Bacillus sp. 31A1R]